MLEKVARAIWEKFGERFDVSSWGELGESDRDLCRAQARAALSALKEVDEGVVEAMANHEWSGGYDRNGSHEADMYVEYVDGLSAMVGQERAKVIASEIFTAAIDHILGEDHE